MTTKRPPETEPRPRATMPPYAGGRSGSVAEIIGKGFRPDIQGLRAVAVVSVVLAHAGVPGVAGGFIGVDLFFVLSGFLISGLLVRELEKRGHISLLEFWSRRARRLLPASALVLAATAVSVYVFLPTTWRLSALTDIVWSSLFAANWRFALTQADYFADTSQVSPVLHFWSLGVEEQFYFVWPFLVVIAGLVSVRLKSRAHVTIRTTIAVLSAIVCLASFAYSVWILQTNQPMAYYGTFSRVWQLSLGALLAALAPWLTSRVGRFSQVLAALGAIGFLASVFILGGERVRQLSWCIGNRSDLGCGRFDRRWSRHDPAHLCLTIA